MGLHQPVDRQHAIDRRFIFAGQFGHHHVGRAAVAAEDHAFANAGAGLHQPAQIAAAAIRRHRHRQGGQRAAIPAAIGGIKRQHDRQRRLPGGAGHLAHHGLAQCQRNAGLDLAFIKAQRIQPVAARHQLKAWAALAHAVVDIDDIGHLMEQFFQLGRGFLAAGGIGPMHFGQQCRHHRRPRRRFHHLHRRAGRQRQRFEPLAQIERHIMAGAVAVIGVGQRDHHVTLFGQPAQEIMAHQAVEVERGRGAGIGLHRHHFRQGAGDAGHLFQHARGRVAAGAFGQIDHHLHFRFVVERQQLDGDGLEIEQRAGGQRGQAHHPQEALGRRTLHDDACGGAAEDLPQSAAAFILVPMQRRTAGQLEHRPWCNHHGHEEGKQHGGRRIDRDRRHIGAHQAGHKQHRQQRGDHGEGGDHRRVADFGHRVDHALHPAAAIVHRPVPGDILDHHDRIIHQDAD